MTGQIIEIDNWVSEDECQDIERFYQSWAKTSTILPHGRFPNQLIANNYRNPWDSDNILGQIIKPKLDLLFENYYVNQVAFLELHLPWDIHCDLVSKTDLIKTPQKKRIPWQSILVPFATLDSATVIFEQTGISNDFYLYKQTATKAENSIDSGFWQDRLSHCWPEDQQYLSIRHVSNSWQRGYLLSFPRQNWHSSDNFHTRINHPKKFLQIFIDHD